MREAAGEDQPQGGPERGRSEVPEVRAEGELLRKTREIIIDKDHYQQALNEYGGHKIACDIYFPDHSLPGSKCT